MWDAELRSERGRCERCAALRGVHGTDDDRDPYTPQPRCRKTNADRARGPGRKRIPRGREAAPQEASRLAEPCTARRQGRRSIALVPG